MLFEIWWAACVSQFLRIITVREIIQVFTHVCLEIWPFLGGWNSEYEMLHNDGIKHLKWHESSTWCHKKHEYFNNFAYVDLTPLCRISANVFFSCKPDLLIHPLKQMKRLHKKKIYIYIFTLVCPSALRYIARWSTATWSTIPISSNGTTKI